MIERNIAMHKRNEELMKQYQMDKEKIEKGEMRIQDSQARSLLLEENRPIVLWALKKFRVYAFYSTDDLISEFNIALLEAIDSYDYSRKDETSFTTYAINGIIMKSRKLYVRQRTNASVVNLNTISLDSMENTERLPDLKTYESPLEIYIQKEFANMAKEKLLFALSHFYTTNQQILIYSYGLFGQKQRDLRYIAKCLNITYSSAREIRSKTMKKIYILLKEEDKSLKEKRIIHNMAGHNYKFCPEILAYLDKNPELKKSFIINREEIIQKLYLNITDDCRLLDKSGIEKFRVELFTALSRLPVLEQESFLKYYGYADNNQNYDSVSLKCRAIKDLRLLFSSNEKNLDFKTKKRLKYLSKKECCYGPTLQKMLYRNKKQDKEKV